MMEINEIFESTTRPEGELFYRSDDPSDSRLGGFVRTSREDFDQAGFVILGSPQDIGVVRNGGCPGASRGPWAIRRMLYRLPVPPEARRGGIFDLGDVCLEETLEEIHRIQEEILLALLRSGKKCIILGGGNDISFPDGAALSRAVEKPLIINIDSHYDVRADDVRNSGTPYR